MIRSESQDALLVERPSTHLVQHHWINWLGAVAPAAVLGVITALIMPRGPATAAQALAVMGSSLLVGLLAGWILPRRRAMLLAPIVYLLAVELARLNAVGPTVDAIRLDKMFYLRDRFDEEKIYLLGESWGTTLAVLAAQQRPDLYHAIIGSGQMVSQRETDRRLYYDVLAYAERTGDEALRAQMLAFGEPPYRDLFAYVFVMGTYERLYKPYTPPQAYLEKGEAAGLGPWNVLGSEYNLVEKANVFRGFLDTAFILYPQLQEIDFRQDVPRLEVPVYVLDGAAELSARRDPALEWFDMLDAPIKRIFTFENAAHAPAFEHFEAFSQIMTETVLPETYSEK